MLRCHLVAQVLRLSVHDVQEVVQDLKVECRSEQFPALVPFSAGAEEQPHAQPAAEKAIVPTLKLNCASLSCICS